MHSPHASISLIIAPLTAILFLFSGIEYSGAAELAGKAEVRCGWFDNPTPGNASLIDRNGEWTISVQGEYEAKGQWPQFKDSHWVRTGNGSSGYGCVCMKVRSNAVSHKIVRILSAHAKPLSACRRDKTLKEPENPLK